MIFVSGHESATMHPDDRWTRRLRFLLIVEIKGFIFLPAIGDVASRNDATWNMLFESGLGNPSALGERVRNEGNRRPRAQGECQYANYDQDNQKASGPEKHRRDDDERAPA